jgi:hypothetical protein
MTDWQKKNFNNPGWLALSRARLYRQWLRETTLSTIFTGKLYTIGSSVVDYCNNQWCLFCRIQNEEAEALDLDAEKTTTDRKKKDLYVKMCVSLQKMKDNTRVSKIVSQFCTMFLFFMLPEKFQGEYCRCCIRPSVCLLDFYIFNFSRTTVLILTKVDISHP